VIEIKKKIKNEINDLMDWVDDNSKADKKDINKRLEQAQYNIQPFEEKKNARKDCSEFSKDLLNKINDTDELANYLSESDKKKNNGCKSRTT